MPPTGSAETSESASAVPVTPTTIDWPSFCRSVIDSSSSAPQPTGTTEAEAGLLDAALDGGRPLRSGGRRRRGPPGGRRRVGVTRGEDRRHRAECGDQAQQVADGAGSTSSS
nr:hypothetical protein ISGA_06885 [Gordonia sp. NB41Y]